ncbi:DUF2651 family protein [Halobacillus sp. A5]|uniref:DUF2651 family protein n=1 Tax=Halobacillus sp. A5 TaxID=2880263 RepID=UPI0020A65CB3|nr:hypothetical protein [Halobacillus sp. A5]MCP3029108.1 hypothetical protein [Halobacillus sp. A5]
MFVELFIVYPFISLVLGGISAFFFKSIHIMPVTIGVICILLMFTLYNLSFWVWCVLYPLCAYAGGTAVKQSVGRRWAGE